MMKIKWVACIAIILVIGVVLLQKLNGSQIKEATVPEESTFFSSATIEESDTYNTQTQGDLWPSCWADDDALYAANGDGDGFTVGQGNVVNVPPNGGSSYFNDIAVSKINGKPEELTGETISKGEQIGQIWNNPVGYNRKPTGMACVGGDLYLAVQDLSKDFNDVPAATIVKSTDKGKTWTWDKTAPMFDEYLFTTIMFLDYGKDYEDAIDEYVYAYGLDYNWRDSFNDRVEDPKDLYLARVPKTSIQDRSAWEFYAGIKGKEPTWTKEIKEKVSVLHDERVLYKDAEVTPNNLTVISQGSVVYNKPLDRYIYTSWTEYTFEFYEAPTPWGPWKLFLSEDFGQYPWSDTHNGGYGVTIPSKFISEDGKTMYVQSNTFMGGANNYNFSLRKLQVDTK
ncbi:DUF4185 domain-containing protein [Robertmurraya kyonggiensis]|uniref:DUF4185 domain-containing protein n=2 Tax=Robertmurraya kyonggiensis TaxID=1037680 RepID=A0A4U1D3G5_9BACI|nr:DUF4185 domain-containing protein [Robertmurraya kyonggiensis]